MSLELQLLEKIESYNPNSDQDLLKKAIEFSKTAHKEQKRASGEPYFTHPLEVAHILADLKLDDSSIITGLLHDTVEDTNVTNEKIKEEFNEEVAILVEGLTKLNKIKYQPENVRQAENFRKLLLAMSKDIRILLIKICDRLHNMRTISHIKSKLKRIKIAQETLEIYAPLTERIGIHKIKDELQDLAFKEINQEVRDSLVQRLEFLKSQIDENIIDKIIADLRSLLLERSIDCKIYGRTKRPYSIWQKMQLKNISFEQLSDIMAFRIIVDSKDECYKVLGAIHDIFPCVPGSFKDYISIPKQNGYQSLHTKVIGPQKRKIEVQIRTDKMHNIAEYGIAAHWSYKQGVNNQSQEFNYRWISELLNILEYSSDPEEFIQNTRLEMYQDQVFCFSPKGDLIALPQGATIIDFAYAVHSDIGNTCMGAKINGVITPLRTILSNGDQVEIICSKNQKPSETWDEFVITGKAKSQIKKHIRSKKIELYKETGKNILQRLFHDKKVELNNNILKKILNIFSKSSVDELYIAVGEGLIAKNDVFKACYPEYKEESKKFISLLKRKSFLKKEKTEANDNKLEIKGVISGMPTHFAGCCHPIKGDKIIGVVHTGKGITVHHNRCRNIKKTNNKDNFIKLSWNEEVSNKLYIGRLKIVSANNFGSISTIISKIASQNINISNLKILHKTDSYYEFIVDLDVEDLKSLQNLKAFLRAIKIIYSVSRG